jgi:hypothetical protein
LYKAIINFLEGFLIGLHMQQSEFKKQKIDKVVIGKV